MARVQQRFSFEATVVSLGDAFFSPLRDAIQRWEHRVPMRTDSVSIDFDVVYELEDGRFVGLRCQCTDQVMMRHFIFWQRQILIGPTPGGAQVIASDAALDLLQAWQYPVPERLRTSLNTRPDLVSPEPSPPRDLSHWASKGVWSYHYKSFVHEVDCEQHLSDLVTLASFAIQDSRTWKADLDLATSDQFDRETWIALTKLLLRRYPVDPNNWWGPKDQIAPATVGLAELQVISAYKDIQTAISEMQVWLGPIAAVLWWQFSDRDPDAPTNSERKIASAALTQGQPRLESWAVRLKTRQVRANSDSEEPSRANVTATKVPPPRSFRLFTLYRTIGKTQAEVAEIYQQETGEPTVQGQVSKAIGEVEEFLAAGNKFPALPELECLREFTWDPSTIDLGKNKTGRSKAQRERNNDKE